MVVPNTSKNRKQESGGNRKHPLVRHSDCFQSIYSGLTLEGSEPEGRPRAVSSSYLSNLRESLKVRSVEDVEGSYQGNRAEQVEGDRGTEKVEKLDFALEYRGTKEGAKGGEGQENRILSLQGDRVSGQGLQLT